MKNKIMTRRGFINKTSLSIAGTTLAANITFASAGSSMKPAILGGAPLKEKNWPGWPIWEPDHDEEMLIKVMRSGVWSRKKVVAEFEEKWAKAVGSRRCLATTNGTNALITALKMLGVDAGDEVITTPYTFIATIDAILLCNAKPVFVDIDPNTYQLDPAKIEEKITAKTRAILPVHILGLPADMDRIMGIAQKHDLIVVEDACQAHFAKYDNKMAGSIGHAGCFSFQNSKNLPIGEGGAIVSDDEDFMDKAFSYHNFGRPYGNMVGDVAGEYIMVGTKCRTTEYQAAIGLAKLKHLEKETQLRHDNAEYLKSLIKDMPGIVPYKTYNKVDRGAFHLFPFRFKKKQFKGMERDQFLKSLKAEGIPCSGGYKPLNTMPYLKDAFSSKVFKAIFSDAELNIEKYMLENQCPENDELCRDMVWLPQNVLLGTRQDMENIALAIEKIIKHADEIKGKA